MTGLVDFAGLLDLLGHDGFTAVCHKTPGGSFSSAVVPATDAPAEATRNDADVWFGANPITGPARRNAGRGTADQVVRLAALYADLDVKAGGLDSFETAKAVIDTISEQLTSRPSVVVFSGHGYQPYWPIEDGPSGPDARALLRRFGRLVAGAAERHGGKVDSVYDLARVLRVPGTTNHKSTPVPVLAATDVGHPLTVTEILEALDGYGVPEQPEDREALTVVVSDRAQWAHAEHTCHYVSAMVHSWKTETPDARHPWLLAQTTRLAAAHRVGCLSAHDHQAATDVLVQRFRALLGGGEQRKESPGEIADAVAWGAQRIACKPDTAVWTELGNHVHADAPLTLVKPEPAPRPQLHVLQGGAQTDGTAALKPQPTTTLARSEDAHSQLLIVHYGDLVRYCPERAAWLAWDGLAWRWQPKGGGLVREYAKIVGRDLPTGGHGATTHKKRSLSSAGITACLGLTETDNRVTVTIGELDADPWTLNTPGGLVDLRTGLMRPSDPAALCTKITTAAPDFVSFDTTWSAFLADTFGDLTIAGYVQRLAGLTMIGAVREQLLAFLHGAGANGKSTLVEALMHALAVGPHGYAIAAPAEMLMIRKHSEHPAELAQLAGARMVVCSELDEGQRFAEAKIKQLTGSDSINARFLYGQPFTFQPSHTFWLLGNHRPQARTGGMAFWRRVKLLEFTHTVAPERRDPALGDKLKAAAGVILAWAIRGAADYYQHGIQEPDAVSKATEAYAADQDTVRRFVEDQVYLCPTNDRARVPVSDLRAAYERWCSEVGEMPVTAKRLGVELAERFQIELVKSNGRRLYAGLTMLRPEGEEEPERDPWYDR